MKNNKIKFKWYIIASLALMSIIPYGCTNLDETVYDQINAKDFYTKDKDFEVGLAGVYFKMLSTIGNIQVEESCTDAAMFPIRGTGGWYNEGKWISMYTHQFKAIVAQTPMQNCYSNYFSVVSAANGLITAMEEKGLNNSFLGEAKVLRAYAYLRLMDSYGGVPIVTTANPDLNNPPVRATRKEVFTFVENELKSAASILPDKHDATTFPRVTKWSAYGLLAKLYIQSKVYNETSVGAHDGPDRWQDCSNICDSIINSGKFSLVNYYDLYVPNNDITGMKEFLMYIDVPRDIIPTQGSLSLGWVTWTITDPVKSFYNLKNAWGGIVILPEFYDSFDTINDIRCTQGILAKNQIHSLDGKLNQVGGTQLKTKAGTPLNFTKYFTVKSNGIAQNLDTAGFRIWKWKPDVALQGAVPDQGLPVVRYADVLLLKAEALIQKNGANGISDGLINQVRKRSILTGYVDKTNCSIEDLYWERRHEFFCELWGRTDQIRLNHWRINPSPLIDATLPAVGSDYFLTRNTEAYTELFPIPRKEIDANPALEQNVGY